MENPNWQPNPDLMQLVLDATTKTGEGRSLEYQVDAIIGTGRAPFFTTGLTIYQLVYDLAVHPEYIDSLRQEILGLGDVPFTRANMNKLSKLDSFIRESQSWRKNMQGKHKLIALAKGSAKLTHIYLLVGTFRKVLDDLTLSDGTLLSAGTYLGTNVQIAVFDDSTLANPCEFDGFRFDRLRSVPDQEQTDQSVQTSADHLDYRTKNQSYVLISLNRNYPEKQSTLICNL